VVRGQPLRLPWLRTRPLSAAARPERPRHIPGTVAARSQNRCGMLPDRRSTFPESDSGHTGTTSIALRVLRASWNAMKPRIQCVLTQ
jgi:hypothetical protein